MEVGDTSNEEASPQHPKKREMSKSQWIQMVTMLQPLQMDNGMRRGAFTMVTECFSMAHSTVHCLWIRVVHMHTRPYYFSRISVPQKKFWETSYLSVGVRLQGNQEHPITQATDPKKAGGVIGGVKDDSATLDC